MESQSEESESFHFLMTAYNSVAYNQIVGVGSFVIGLVLLLLLVTLTI